MADKLTDADLVFRMQLLREYPNAASAATEAGVAVRNFLASIAAAKAKGLTADTIIKDPLAAAKQKIKRLEIELKSVRKHNEDAEEIRKVIYGLAEHSPDPPAWINRAKTSGTPGCPMTIWSDWHYGEVVRKAEVGGVNEFNSEIAQERIRRLVDRTIRLTKGFAFKERGRDVKFPGIIICLGGDMISGDIHEELADTNDRKPLECIDELLDLLIAALTKMADEFGHVFVPCVVGNHGRTTRKPRMKGRIVTSYEWNLYCNLERCLRNDRRINFFVPNETDAFFTVLGQRFLLTHGDSLGVKGGDGIIGAIGPIMRGTLKTSRSEAHVGRDFDTLVIGHWHQTLWLPQCIVNNCLKGYDEYARLVLRAPYSRPAQSLWFVHEEQGITAQMSVYVDELKKPAKKPDWVVVPRAA